MIVVYAIDEVDAKDPSLEVVVSASVRSLLLSTAPESRRRVVPVGICREADRDVYPYLIQAGLRTVLFFPNQSIQDLCKVKLTRFIEERLNEPTDACLFVSPKTVFVKDVTHVCGDVSAIRSSDDARVHIFPTACGIVDASLHSDALPAMVRMGRGRWEDNKGVVMEGVSSRYDSPVCFLDRQSSMVVCDNLEEMERCLDRVSGPDQRKRHSRVVGIELLREKKIRQTYYAVVLKSRPERVEHVEAVKKEMDGIAEVREVPAIEGSTELDATTLRGLVDRGFLVPPFEDAFVEGRPISVNSVASFLSHRRALERFLADCSTADDNREGEDRVGIFFEDDVVVPDGILLHAAVERIAQRCLTMDPRPDVVQLYVMPQQRGYVRPHTSFSSTRRVRDGEGMESHQIAPSPPGTWGMQCYMARPEGARKMLDGLFPMLGATDEQFSRIDMNLYCIIGPPLVQEDLLGAPSVTGSGSTTVREALKKL
jgi:GR25 family glycosyltransferase involved in LPS biosynthesis